MPTTRSQYVAPEPFTEILNRGVIDSNGTCKIYYHPIDRASSIFDKPANIAETRNLEFHYHMQPDKVANRTAYPHPHPSLERFKQLCPVWHFAVPEHEAPKPVPRCTIVVEHHGGGRLPDDYDGMVFLLLELMNEITKTGFEDVGVRIRARTESHFVMGTLPEREEVMKMRSLFEDRLGKATLSETGGEYQMEFRPRLARSWYL